MNVKQAVPFFAVSDMQKSIRYYVDGLGYTMTNQWVDDGGRIRWCWLRKDATALMLQEFSTPYKSKAGEGVTICFICEDALAIYHEVLAKGIEASRPFVGNNMWVVSLTDPDGYRLDFESPTDVPEETVYSEDAT